MVSGPWCVCVTPYQVKKVGLVAQSSPVRDLSADGRPITIKRGKNLFIPATKLEYRVLNIESGRVESEGGYGEFVFRVCQV